MTICWRQKDSISGYLACDCSLLSGGKEFTNFLLLVLVCRRTQDQTDTVSKELGFFGNHAAFDAWAGRQSRVKRKIITKFLLLALVRCHTLELNASHTSELNTSHTLELNTSQTLELIASHTLELNASHTLELNTSHTLELNASHTLELNASHTLELNARLH